MTGYLWEKECWRKLEANSKFFNLRDFDGNVDWERHLNFLDDWDFDFLVHWVLLNVMVVNGMNVVWDRDLNVFAASKKNTLAKSTSEVRKSLINKNERIYSIVVQRLWFIRPSWWTAGDQSWTWRAKCSSEVKRNVENSLSVASLRGFLKWDNKQLNCPVGDPVGLFHFLNTSLSMALYMYLLTTV